MRRVVLAILLAALLLPVAPADAATTDAVTLLAGAQGGDAAVTLTARPGRELQIVVTHRDPLVGTVVDRVERVVADATGKAVLRLEGLRVGADLDVCALDAGLELPELPNATRQFDGAQVEKLARLACDALAPLLPQARDHHLPVVTYPVVEYQDDAGLRITRAGHVVVVAHEGSGPLRALVSRDGGHTFPIAFDLGAPADGFYWDAGESANGSMVVAYQPWMSRGEGQTIAAGEWHLAAFHPARDAAPVVRRMGGADNLTFHGWGAARVLVLPSQTLLAFAGLVQRVGEGGNETLHGPENVTFWRLDGAGMTFAGALRSPTGFAYNTWTARASPGGAIGIVASMYQGTHQRDAHYAASSLDGGATFTPWRELPAIWPAHPNWLPYRSETAVDDTGTLHVQFFATRLNESGGTPSLYARVPPAPLPVVLHDLRDATPVKYEACDSSWPRGVQTDRGRVWTVWEMCNDTWIAESLDGGLTLGDPLRLRNVGRPEGGAVYGPGRFALFPDGRPGILVSFQLDPALRSHLGLAVTFDPDPGLQAPLLRGETTSFLRLEAVDGADVHVAAGATTRARVTLTNLAPYPVLVQQITAAGGSGFTVTADFARGEPLPVGGSLVHELAIQADPSLGAPATLNVQAWAPYVLAPPSLALTLRPHAQPIELAVAAPEPMLPGASTTMRVRLENRARLALPGRVLWIDAPSGIIATPARVELSDLAPLEVREIDVTLAASGDAAGDLSLTVRVELPGGLDSRAVEVPLRILLREGSPAPNRNDSSYVSGQGEASSPERADHPALDSQPTRDSDATADASPTIAPDSSVAGGAPAGRPIAAPAMLAAGGSAFVATTVALVAATEAGRWWLAAAAAALYSRLSRPQVLSHESRERLLALVAREPGARFEEIRRALGFSYGALAHHLKVLEREGYLLGRLDWAHRRYYPVGHAPPSAGPALAGDRIVRLLGERPGIGQSDVARELRMSRQLASYHLAALEKSGRVTTTREGRRVRYSTGASAGARPGGR